MEQDHAPRRVCPGFQNRIAAQSFDGAHQQKQTHFGESDPRTEIATTSIFKANAEPIETKIQHST